MLDNLGLKVRRDFSHARTKAFFNKILNTLGGQPKTLLSYDDVKEKLHIGGPVYRGMQVVPIEKIVGSLNRYHEFDRAFLPLEDETANRWQNIDRAFYRDVSLPPIVLYKVGEVYFVVDGHHRVSVAREKGQKYIDAEVKECQTKVNITHEIRPEDLVILGEKVNFLERTKIDHLRPKTKIKLTIPDGFDRMIEHIAVHRFFMGIDMQRDISEEEAIAHWHDTVYQPIVRAIRGSGVLKHFPGKTEADLYLWILDRQRYLSQEGHDLASPRKAAEDFIKGVK